MKRQSSFVLVIALVMTAALGAQQAASTVADAAARGDKTAIRDLLKQGADVNAAQGDGMSALHWAAERGDAELADLLIYGGANTGAVTRIGQYTPLHLAAKTGSPAVVKALIKAGADVNAKSNPSGATPVHLAALAGSADVINLLADAKADLNAREAEWEQTPLIFAASANRAEAITTLIKRGADPNLASKTIDVTKQGQLDRAAVDRQRKVIEGFIGKDSAKRPTPAQMQAAIEASRELLKSGVIPPPDPNAPPPRGFNPEEINPPVSAKGGMTALLHAARQGYIPSAEALLDGGADINKAQTGDNTSPLLTAVINGQFDMAMVLIKRGADTEPDGEEQRRVAALGGRQHHVAAAHALPAASGDGAAEAHLPRGDAGAARQGRGSEPPHQLASLVPRLHGLRQPQLRSGRHDRFHRILARRVRHRPDGHEAARRLRRRPDHPDDVAA